MKIVVLDGHTLNPGDLGWERLEELGSCDIYDRTRPEKILERTKGAEIVLTNKVVIDKATMDSLPDLKYLGLLSTGTNVIDLEAAREKDIPVTNVPSYATPAVAQTVFALILELTHRAGHHSTTVHEGRWTESVDFCYWDYPLVELNGLTMGIVGFGSIGSAVAGIALGFGMKVLAYGRDTSNISKPGVETADLDTLFSRSDVVSLNCPLTPETEGLVNKKKLSQMKKTAFLINTARGPLVNEKDLADALNSGRIAGAGLDVLSVEPPAADNPLLGAKNCFITPHIAWASHAARGRLMQTVVDNVKAFLEGQPKNVVN